MSSSELLPCPFCGDKAYVYEYEEHVDSPFYWRAECETCYGNVREARSKEEAIRNWNMRAEHRLKTETPKLIEEDVIEF